MRLQAIDLLSLNQSCNKNLICGLLNVLKGLITDEFLVSVKPETLEDCYRY